MVPFDFHLQVRRLIQEPPFKFFPLLGEIHGRVTRRTSCRAIAGFALASRTAKRPTLSERQMDLLAAMAQFGSPDHLTCRIVDHGDAARFGSRIEFDPQWFNHGLWPHVFEDEHERKAAQNRSFVALEELARTGGGARHERPALLVYYQYS
jgi:hypothetical protein